MQYLYLTIAVVAEVTATGALKASEEFTRLAPSVPVIISYGVAFYFLTPVLRTVPVAIAYAVWSGLGIVLVAVIGAVVYGQVPDLPTVIGLALIVAGVCVANAFSKTVVH